MKRAKAGRAELSGSRKRQARDRHDDIIGLDIGAAALKVAVVRDEQVLRVGRMPLKRGTIVDGVPTDPDALAAQLRRLWRRLGLRSRRVNFSIANRTRSGYRYVVLPRSQDEKNLHLAITANAETWFAPLKLSEVIIDFAEQSSDSPLQMPLEIVCAEKDLVSEYLKALRRAKLVPMACGYGPLACSKALVAPRDRDGAFLHVDIGAEKTAINVVNGAEVLHSQIVELAGNEITEAIGDELGLDFDEAEELKVGYGLTGVSIRSSEQVTAAQKVMLDYADRLGQAIADARLLYERSQGGRPLKGVIFSGGGARLAGLSEQIALTLGFSEALPLQPRPSFRAVRDFDLFATAISLAWRKPVSLMPRIVTLGAGASDSPIQPKLDRRAAEKAARELRKEYKKSNPLLAGALIGFLALGGMFYWGQQLRQAAPELPPVLDQGARYANSEEATRLAALIPTIPPPESVRQLSSFLLEPAFGNASLSFLTGGMVVVSGSAPAREYPRLLAQARNLPGLDLVSARKTPAPGGAVSFTLRWQRS
jgi:type IV pilus assembly protein PilM